MIANNTTNGSTIRYDWEPVSPAPYMFAVLGTTWTTVANAVILICFYRNRGRTWSTFNRLTCSMAVSDLLVGLTGILFLIKDGNGGRLNDVGCLLSFYLISSTHVASLLHVLGICIYRIVQINNMETVSSNFKRTENKAGVSMVVTSWVLPFLLQLIPYSIFGKVNGEVIQCSVETAFGDEVHQFALFTSLIYVVAQWATNFIYIITLFRLKLKLRSAGRSKNIAENREGNSESNIPESANTRVGLMPSTVRKEKRVIGTIGILLLLFNIFTLHVSIAGFLEGVEIRISRDVRYIFSSFFVMNSGLNPVVYAARIPSIRKAVKDLVIDIRNFVCKHREEPVDL